MEFKNDTSFHFSDHPLSDLPIELLQKLEDNSQLVSNFRQNKLEKEAKKNWDLFYKRNETKFFRDRHWTKREFEDLVNDNLNDNGENRPTLLEIGCGVGNFIWPLIGEKTTFYIYATDFSPRAIDFVKRHPLYDETQTCQAFVSDLTCEDSLQQNLSDVKVNIASLIFVLSAIHPDKMASAIRNIYNVLANDGVLLFRDYGLHDYAQLRFSPANKLGDHFYVRQDGTRAFYFSLSYVKKLFSDCGFKVVNCEYVQRETVNKKEGISVPRIFVQGKFIKA